MKDSLMTEKEINEIYSKMAIEIMEQMKKRKDITSLVNKDNILSLLEKIKENGLYFILNLMKEWKKLEIYYLDIMKVMILLLEI